MIFPYISSTNNEGENGNWNLIDANTEMDDQTANQLLNSLQSNYWHGKLSIYVHVF